MNYQANEALMVYHWVGTGLKRKVLFGSGVASGRVKFIDNSLYYEVNLGDTLGLEWIHDDNLRSFEEWIAERRVYEVDEMEIE